MNFGRKMMKAGVAAVAAIATLGAGGVVASTAFAGGGGGNQPGTGGDLAAVQFWQYKDDASGAWGPATMPATFMSAVSSTYFILAPECLGGLLNAKTAEGATIYNTAVAYPIGIIFAIAMLAVFLHATKKAAQKA